MNLVNTLLEVSDKFAEKQAIIEKSNSISFKGLREFGLKIGSLLMSKGLKKGDYVLVLQPMSVKLYSVLIGLWSIGAIPLFFDPSAGKTHIRKCCSIMKPSAFIGSNKALLLSFYSKEIKNIPVKISTGKNLFTASIKDAWSYENVAIEGLNEDFPGIITFTSGSTGEPKAAVRTHGFLLKQYEILNKSLGYKAGQIDLATLPVFTLTNIAAGLTTIIPDADLRKVGSINAGKVVKQIQKYKISRVTASPSFIKCLVDYSAKNNIKLESLSEVHTGGGPVFPRLIDKIREVIPNARIVAVYGSTEAEPIADIDWADITDEDIASMSSGGGLLAGNTVGEINCRVIKAQWGKPLGTLNQQEFDAISLYGEIGEIVVNGEHVLKGYYNGVGDDENKFDVDGSRWHRTGDSGYFDHDGRLWLMGRASARIVDDRGELYPFSVECAVNINFNIERSALIQADGLRILVLERNEDIKLEEITQSLKWAKLDKIHFVKKIPLDKRHNAKIDYPALRKLI